jgi:YD repeat-containing protein
LRIRDLRLELSQSSTTVRSFSYDGAGNVIADTRGSTTYKYIYNKRSRRPGGNVRVGYL